MTSKQISFSIFSESDHSRRQFSVSKLFLTVFILSLCAAVGLTVCIAARRYTLIRALPAKVTLEEMRENQQALILAREKQITLLYNKLDGLEDTFAQLLDMKKEICQIGRIEQPVNHENLFGIGGSRLPAPSTGKAVEDNPAAGDGNFSNPFSNHFRLPASRFDRTAMNDRKLVLEHSDFFINPIACIPSSPPTSVGLAEAAHESEQLFAGTGNGNQGILLKAAQGSDVTAPANGIITFVDAENNSGETVIIDHGHGYITRYACLAGTGKKPGELVLKGDIIGRVKPSVSEAPSQFYYEIILNGLPVNPEKYINRTPFLL